MYDRTQMQSLTFRNRHIQDSPLSTLPAFLKACQLLLHMILPIPPYATNQLRAEHMLRLTSTCDDVVGYDLSSRPAKQALFGFLNELVCATSRFLSA